MKRKILSLILVFAMTVSLLTVGTGAVEPTYGDTAGHWAESSIERWSGHGIIQGSNGLFDPNGQLTCAQLATILAKLLKLPAAKDAGFTDNTADAWYYDAVNRCAAAGILNGNGDGTVTPDAPISRERAIVMLGRALGIEPIRKPDLTKYTDAAKVAPYAQGMVAAMIEAGIVGGVTADELAPQDNINRASTVTILDRAISTYADKAGATVKADGKGIVLVVAENVKITGAPEGTKIVVADGATGLTVNGKSVSDDQTYIIPKTTTGSGSSSGGYSHSHSYNETTHKCSCGAFDPAVVATIGDETGYLTLKDAVAAATNGQTVKLMKNASISESLTIKNTITLNLNDKTITACEKAFKILADGSNPGGFLTVMGKGTIDADYKNGVFFLIGSDNSDDDKAAKLVVRENVNIINSNYTFWIDRVSGKNVSYNVAVDIYGKVTADEPVYVSGNIHAAEGNVPTIYIHSGAEFNIFGNDELYLAGYAKTTIDPGTKFTNAEGNTVTIAAGELVINGGTFNAGSTIGGVTGTGGAIDVSTSSAVYVQQHTTNLPIKVTVNDGLFTAAIPFYQEAGANGETSAPQLVDLAISGGTFTSNCSVEGGVSVKSANKTNFITGGTFSSDPSAYVAERCEVTMLEGGKYQVVALFAGGTGTAEDPFVIQNAEQLKAFRDNVNAGNTFAGKTIELTADIDLNNTEWTPIGTNEHPFSGSFDGQNHTVSNLKITNAGSYNGLFGKVVGITDGASFKTTANEVWNAEAYTLSNCEESQFKTIIKDFTIDHFSVMTGEYGAAAIGWAENAYLSKISVSNGSVNDNNAAEKGKIAAVVGVSAKNMVYDQLTTAEGVQVVGGKHSVAGIVSSIQRGNNGQPHLVVIKNCVNNAKVSWSNGNKTGGGYPIAGIVANAGSCSGLEVVIYQCTNNGQVVANECDYACGIVGQAGDWVKAIYDCHNTGAIEAEAAIGVAGICITENTPAIACSNSGTLTNSAEGGHTYDISSSISQLTIVNETFADVSALQTRINNAVGTATTLILKNITVTNPTGTLTIPDVIQHISANTKVCDSISLPNALVNIDMIELTQTVTGTVCRTFSGSGNRITVAGDSTIENIVIAGTNNIFTNNGTMGNVAISGNGMGIVINNESDATMAGMTMIDTTATATLNNHGTMNRTAGGHCVWVEANGTLTVNNYGSISAAYNYALLFYGDCTIIVNAYAGSSVTGDFAPYRGTHKINVNYQTGATYNDGSWTNLPDYSQYGVTVSVM